MKYGFEREYFVRRGETYILVPDGIAFDACGFLAEARGEAHRSPLSAAYLLKAAAQLVQQEADKAGVQLVLESTVRIPRQLRLDAMRKFGKAALPASRGHLYGRFKPFSASFAHAGLHVHFSDEEIVETKAGSTRTIPRIFDFVTIMQKLDQAFAVEIKTAKRAPGYFEMKPWGVEYRSLPNTVEPEDVASVLQSIR